MSVAEGDLISYFEAENYIKSLEQFEISEYGSPRWIRQHEYLEKLMLQALRNAKAREDEFVQDSFLTWDKIKLVVYDLIMSEVWKA
jgi:hypothetical protein